MIDPLPFATYSFVMSITPGPNNVMLTASGAAFGFRRTLPHLLGISLGCGVQLLSVCAGFGVIFARWPALHTTLRWVGAAYLIYLGWKLLGSSEVRVGETRRPITCMQAAMFQFVNPKAWLVTITAASVFMPRQLGLVLAGAYMLAMMFAVNLPCVAVWAMFGSSLRNVLARPRARSVFNLVMALCLAATALAMVL